LVNLKIEIQIERLQRPTTPSLRATPLSRRRGFSEKIRGKKKSLRFILSTFANDGSEKPQSLINRKNLYG
jgi:hypothetical protein